MPKNRLEAFSDGVLAIIITIMVLELKAPHEESLHGLLPMAPTICAYVLSFIYVGIFWNNHHHMFHATEEVSGSVLWANLHLLFWLSLLPVVTDWLGESHLAPLPTGAYGFVLLMAAIAYLILQRRIITLQGPNSLLAEAVGRDVKGKLSGVLYLCGIGAAYLEPKISAGLYVLVALIWLIPDRRIERTLKKE